MDRISPEQRSANMAKIRSRNTKPELVVRRFLHSKGLRYKLHRTSLPGTPDLVFPGRQVCVFVHGCFWHGCPKCVDGTRAVKSNGDYWSAKVRRNQERDRRRAEELGAAGWKVLAIWECETGDPAKLSLLAEMIRFAG
jgi:DNA mismatch endonuclease, patch repair protein